MVKRVIDKDKVGFVEYSDDGVVQRVKKFYGEPRFFTERRKNPKTKETEEFRVENATQSWKAE